MFTIGCFGEASAASFMIDLNKHEYCYQQVIYYNANQTSSRCPATLAAGFPGSFLIIGVPFMVRICGAGLDNPREQWMLLKR